MQFSAGPVFSFRVLSHDLRQIEQSRPSLLLCLVDDVEEEWGYCPVGCQQPAPG
jgi:hypothetical protein